MWKKIFLKDFQTLILEKKKEKKRDRKKKKKEKRRKSLICYHIHLHESNNSTYLLTLFW